MAILFVKLTSFTILVDARRISNGLPLLVRKARAARCFYQRRPIVVWLTPKVRAISVRESPASRRWSRLRAVRASNSATLIDFARSPTLATSVVWDFPRGIGDVSEH